MSYSAGHLQLGPTAMNNRIYPSSLGSISPKESLEKGLPPEGFAMRERPFMSRWGRFFLLLFLVSIGIGVLYLVHPDVAIGVAVVVAYTGLYWAYRKTQGPRQKPGYPVIRYRGHPERKKGFFS